MYKNIKNGVKAELIEINEKTRMVTLKKADGKFTSPGIGSFEKYWKKIDDNDPSSKKPSSKQAKALDVATDTKEAEPAPKAVEEEKKPEAPKKSEKKEKAEKPKKERKPKKEDKQVITTIMQLCDELKVTHKESWQNKGTAVYVGKIRVFECWKRMERVRINYNPELTNLAKFYESKEEDKRTNVKLSVTCYVKADEIPNAIKALVSNMNQDKIKELSDKKEEKKPKKKEKVKSEKGEK